MITCSIVLQFFYFKLLSMSCHQLVRIIYFWCVTKHTVGKFTFCDSIPVNETCLIWWSVTVLTNIQILVFSLMQYCVQCNPLHCIVCTCVCWLYILIAITWIPLIWYCMWGLPGIDLRLQILLGIFLTLFCLLFSGSNVSLFAIWKLVKQLVSCIWTISPLGCYYNV